MSHNRRMSIGYANILAMQLIYMASEKLDTLRHIGSRDRNIDYGNTLEFNEF